MASFWESLRQIWIPTSSTRLTEAEQRVLSVVRFPFQQNQIPIGDELTINTLHIYNPKAKREAKRSPLVLLHGFGAGIGFWLLNLDALAEQHEHIYAIDMLGCGRSSRPTFRVKTSEEAEQFFVDALEGWRIRLSLDKMILLGHSFGGYIAASYAMSFPSCVSHLILASPVGVPEEPDITEDPELIFSLGRGRVRDFALYMWNRGYTPLSIVRFIGPMGRQPIKAYVTRRFKTGPATEDASPVTTEDGLETSAALANQIDQGRLKLSKEDVAEYLYHLSAQPGCGEFALPLLIKSNFYAYKPLEKRLENSDVSRVTFMYGNHDWMDSEAGLRTVKALNTRPNFSKLSAFYIIPHAGHQLMIDNPDRFHEAIRLALLDHRE